MCVSVSVRECGCGCQSLCECVRVWVFLDQKQCMKKKDKFLKSKSKHVGNDWPSLLTPSVASLGFQNFLSCWSKRKNENLKVIFNVRATLGSAGDSADGMVAIGPSDLSSNPFWR